MTFRQILTIIAIVWLILINLTAFIAYGVDKRKAVKGQWRIPEATLWTIALLGGSIGSYITMRTIRHKTQHKSFMIGFPAIISFQVAIITYLILKTEFGSF